MFQTEKSVDFIYDVKIFLIIYFTGGHLFNGRNKEKRKTIRFT